MLKKVQHIPWKIVGYVCLAWIGLAGVGMLMGLVYKKDVNQVCTAMKVIVEGKETFIDQKDISELIDRKFGAVKDRPVIDIPVQQMEVALAELPYVSSAQVYADMDGILHIVVQQREVILRIINKSGQEYYIDTQGAKVPVTLKYVPHVLVANGNIAEGYSENLDTIRTKIVKDLVDIVNHVRGDELWSNQIVQLYVNDNSDIEIIPRVGLQQFILGDAHDLEGKLKRLVVFYKNILPKVGEGAYEKVNVKYDGQIICERKNGWFLDSLQMKMKMN